MDTRNLDRIRRRPWPAKRLGDYVIVPLTGRFFRLDLRGTGATCSPALILGAAYLLAGRNLWASVLGHGFIDTFAVIFVYFGGAD